MTVSSRLAGKTALVTGGSRGIGAAIAERFADEGADVVITFASNVAAADATAERLRARGRRAEALRAGGDDPHAIHAMVDRAASLLGGLDILVHNAGVSEYRPITEASEADYLHLHRRHFRTNVEDVVALTAAALPHMRQGGRVIMIGSVNAHQMPFEGTAIYGASKAALAALAQGWARDLGPRGILVNVIQPGPINTEMNPDDEREAVKHMTGMTALKRYGRPSEIAAVAAFLASDDASYITGTSLDVDGGFSI